MTRAEVLQKIRDHLEDPEEIYLVNHYRRGDTGVPSFVAGALLVLLEDEEEVPKVSELKVLAKKLLDEMLADPKTVARLDAMEAQSWLSIDEMRRQGAQIEDGVVRLRRRSSDG